MKLKNLKFNRRTFIKRAIYTVLSLEVLYVFTNLLKKKNDKGVYINVRVRNEALDCRVYALAVLAIMNINVNLLPRPIVYIGEAEIIKHHAVEKREYKEPDSHLDEF